MKQVNKARLGQPQGLEDTNLAGWINAPVGIPAAENHEYTVQRRSQNGFDGWNRLVRKVANARNQHSFWVC